MKTALTLGTSLQGRIPRYLNIKHKKVGYILWLPLLLYPRLVWKWKMERLICEFTCSMEQPSLCEVQHQTSCSTVSQLPSPAAAAQLSVGPDFHLCWLLNTTQAALSQQAYSTIYQRQNLSSNIELSQPSVQLWLKVSVLPWVIICNTTCPTSSHCQKQTAYMKHVDTTSHVRVFICFVLTATAAPALQSGLSLTESLTGHISITDQPNQPRFAVWYIFGTVRLW